MKRPLVSVIIPSYNSEKFLEESVLSVINQSYKNLEIIIVNDGSTDGTLAIADKLAKRDKRVVVVSKKNGGLGFARNTGIEHSNGKYIYLLDADDKITEHCLEHLVEIAETKGVDVVCTMVDQNLKKEKLGKKIKVQSGLDTFCDVMDRVVPTAAWGRLYNKEVFKETVFSNIRYAEDFEFNTRFWLKIGNVAVVNDYTYVYSTTPGSMVNSPYDSKKAEIIPVLKKLENEAKQCQFPPRGCLSARSGCFLHALSTLMAIHATGVEENKDDYTTLKKMAKRNSRYAFSNKNLSKQNRRYALCCMVSVDLTIKLIERAYRKNYGKD